MLNWSKKLKQTWTFANAVSNSFASLCITPFPGSTTKHICYVMTNQWEKMATPVQRETHFLLRSSCSRGVQNLGTTQAIISYCPSLVKIAEMIGLIINMIKKYDLNFYGQQTSYIISCVRSNLAMEGYKTIYRF